MNWLRPLFAPDGGRETAFIVVVGPAWPGSYRSSADKAPTQRTGALTKAGVWQSQRERAFWAPRGSAAAGGPLDYRHYVVPLPASPSWEHLAFVDSALAVLLFFSFPPRGQLSFGESEPLVGPVTRTPVPSPSFVGAPLPSDPERPEAVQWGLPRCSRAALARRLCRRRVRTSRAAERARGCCCCCLVFMCPGLPRRALPSRGSWE